MVISRLNKTPVTPLAKSKRKGSRPGRRLKVRVVVHKADEGGFWAEVPALPGCFTQGETRRELIVNLREAIQGCLLARSNTPIEEGGTLEEIAL